MKNRYKIPLIAFIASIVFVLLLGLSSLAPLAIKYQARYVKCEPRKVTQILEQLFDLEISPVDQEAKAAITAVFRGAPPEYYRSFIIKFYADPNKLNESFRSLSDETGEQPDKYAYSKENDLRDNPSHWTPKWFLTPIEQGTIYGYHFYSHDSLLDLEIYVESITTDKVLVYLRGNYQVTKEIRKLGFGAALVMVPSVPCKRLRNAEKNPQNPKQKIDTDSDNSRIFGDNILVWNG